MCEIMKSKLIFSLMAVMVLFAANTGWAKMTGFSATGVLLEIDEGDVSPAGNSGRFVVKDRQITGELTLISDDSEEGIDYPFTLTYGTNVPLDQAGQAHGTIDIGNFNEYEAKFRAETSFGPILYHDVPVMALLIDGKMTFKKGTQGNGTLDAWIIPILDDDFHIIGIFDSELTIDGKWKE